MQEIIEQMETDMKAIMADQGPMAIFDPNSEAHRLSEIISRIKSNK